MQQIFDVERKNANARQISILKITDLGSGSFTLGWEDGSEFAICIWTFRRYKINQG